MYIGIKAVKPLSDYKLQLLFENGEKRIFDVSNYLSQGVFQALRDKKRFNKVRVNFDSVEWENGVDLDPELLHSESIPYK